MQKAPGVWASILAPILLSSAANYGNISLKIDSTTADNLITREKEKVAKPYTGGYRVEGFVIGDKKGLKVNWTLKKV